MTKLTVWSTARQNKAKDLLARHISKAARMAPCPPPALQNSEANLEAHQTSLTAWTPATTARTPPPQRKKYKHKELIISKDHLGLPMTPSILLERPSCDLAVYSPRHMVILDSRTICLLSQQHQCCFKTLIVDSTLLYLSSISSGILQLAFPLE